MKFNDSDVRPNGNRPLAQCGAMVAPGQDLRWRGLGRTETNAHHADGRQTVDATRAHETQYRV